jgi:hypothetical protein
MVPDHHGRADIPVDRGLKHPCTQRGDELPAGVGEEAVPGWLPLDLLTGRQTELGADRGEIRAVAGYGPLGDKHAADRKKLPEPAPRRVRLLTIVEEDQPQLSSSHRYRVMWGTSSPAANGHDQLFL